MVSPRAYTLAEIDGMREDIKAIKINNQYGWSNVIRNEDSINKIIEEELRTYMIGNINPFELHDKRVKLFKAYWDEVKIREPSSKTVDSSGWTG